MKNADLPHYPYSSSLWRTATYASLLGISGALHLAVFDQPVQWVFFRNLLVVRGFHVCKQIKELTKAGRAARAALPERYKLSLITLMSF